MNKLGSLATFFGIGLVALNSAVYTVDPGEKALIMDKVKGLKQEVYTQGYHLLIPGIQVLVAIITRPPSSMTAVWGQSTSTSSPVPKTYKQSQFHWESSNNPSLSTSPPSINFWAVIMKRKSSTPSVSKSSELLSPNVIFVHNSDDADQLLKFR